MNKIVKGYAELALEMILIVTFSYVLIAKPFDAPHKARPRKMNFAWGKR